MEATVTFNDWWKEACRYGSDAFNIWNEKHFRGCWEDAQKALGKLTTIPGREVLRHTEGYEVLVEDSGTVTVTSPRDCSSFYCSVPDLPAMLLEEVRRSDELRDEVERLRGLVDGPTGLRGDPA
jgi:hypothetical protein